jgi:hypothetical protein
MKRRQWLAVALLIASIACSIANHALERSRSSLTLMMLNTVCAGSVVILIARRRV